MSPIRKVPRRGPDGPRPGGPRRLVPRAAALAGLALLATGCQSNAFTRMGMLQPVTRQGLLTLHLWQGSWIAAWAVGIVVWFLIGYTVVRHRRRKDSPDALPDQVRYNLPIEVLYTVLPFVMVGVLFYFTARDEDKIDALSAHPDVVVNVLGYQWSWQFQYPQYALHGNKVYSEITDTGNQWNPNLPNDQQHLPLLVIPENETVRFNLVSHDVDHSFDIPQFDFKRDLIPGHPNHFQVTPDRTGSFIGHCSELCGLYHSRMLFAVKVVTPAQFRQWTHAQQIAQSGSSGGTP